MKVFEVSITTSRVGMGMAKGRTRVFWHSLSCNRASSGMNVMPCPASTMRMNVSMLPSE